MANPAISARLRYLNEAAHALSQNAPSTSKYLMSTCHALMFDNSLDQSESHKRKVCGACGHIIDLSLGDTVSIDTEIKSRKVRPRKSTGMKTVVYTCISCRRKTRHELGPAPTAIRKSPISISTFNPASSGTLNSSRQAPQSSSTNVGSKKRAKLRKQAGLGALLARSKESEARNSNAGFGLDLLDLMKKT
ncbi:hypothetical protein F5884DRAFT_664407 [Xylogone sp. PMI_703]|nr:hypothetical protein F5884DRAFT_664407 [Xylogone sp. PMI_703]